MAVWLAGTGQAEGPAGPVLFLDRDGVVIRDCDYLADPAAVEIIAGVGAAMVRARAAGFRIVGVSNQSGIGRGYFTEDDFGAVMARLAADLDRFGARFDGFYYCPHAPDAGCACRKPLAGLLTEAAADFRWDPSLSWLVGDKMSDLELGRAAGLGLALVRTGYGVAAESAVRKRWPADRRLLVADDLPAAVDAILARPEFAADGKSS